MIGYLVITAVAVAKKSIPVFNSNSNSRVFNSNSGIGIGIELAELQFQFRNWIDPNPVSNGDFVGLYRMNSNLSELNSILFLTAQQYTVSRSVCSCVISSLLAIAWPTRVSSAKLDRKEVTMSLSISPMRMRKRRGPKTDPCGTPDSAGLGWDFFPFTRMHWRRPLRKLSSHLPRFPCIPSDFSFLRVLPISTLSKALAKSLNSP